MRVLGLMIFAGSLVGGGCSGDDAGGGAETDGGSGSASSSAGTGGSGGSNSGGTAGSASGGSGGCAEAPTFEKDVIPIFEKSCGTADGDCHFRGAYGAQVDAECRGWLTLENSALGSEFYSGPDEGLPTGCPDRTLYERLTDLDAWNCDKYDERRRYVVPCEPENSYLFHKISGGPLCNLDKDGMNDVSSWPMPPPPEELENAYVLGEAEAQILYDWIAAGAPLDGQACSVTCEGSGGSTGGSTTGEGTGGSSTGGVGGVPEVQINHPGDGEQRQVNQNIPLVGVANDAEDGALGGASLVWNSSIEGDVATGAMSDWVPTQTGTHTLTLTATDSDSNEGSDAITIEVIP